MLWFPKGYTQIQIFESGFVNKINGLWILVQIFELKVSKWKQFAQIWVSNYSTVKKDL